MFMLLTSLTLYFSFKFFQMPPKTVLKSHYIKIPTWNRTEHPDLNVTTAVIISYILVECLRDELPFAVDAGVGALAGDLLLLLGDAARRRGCPTCVQGAWDSLRACRGGGT